MDKLAQVRDAEVAGVISGLIDAGYIKVASDDEFEELVSDVSSRIDGDWDVAEVLNKTAEIINGDDDMYKTAEEEYVDELCEDMGRVVILKEAGYISDYEFEKEAEGIWNAVKDVFKGTRARNAWGELRGEAGKTQLNNLKGKKRYLRAVKKLKNGDIALGGQTREEEIKRMRDEIKDLRKVRNVNRLALARGIAETGGAYGASGAAVGVPSYMLYKHNKRR